MAFRTTCSFPSMVLATTVAVQFTNIRRPGCRASLPLRCPRLAAWPLATEAICSLQTPRFDPGSQTYQATIVKITPGGVQSTFGTLSGTFPVKTWRLIAQANLFVSSLADQNDPNQASTIYKFTPRGVQSTFGSMPGQGFGLAFDGAGNLFAADAPFQTIWKFTPDGTRSVFVIPSIPPAQGPVGLAFDRFGNLFVSTESNPVEPDMIL